MRTKSLRCITRAQVGLSSDVIEALAMHGAHMVENQAARIEHEQNEQDLRNRYEST